MSIFQYEILNQDLSEMSKIPESDLINSFLRLDKHLRMVIESLCTSGVAKIDNPSIPQRRKVLAWLSQNPLILRNGSTSIASPNYYSYHETPERITVNGEISGFMEQLAKALKRNEVPPIHLKRRRTAALVADLVLAKKQRKSLPVEELKKVLEVSDEAFESYNDIIGVLEPIQREFTSAGGSFKYYPDDDEQVTKITIDVIYPKGK